MPCAGVCAMILLLGPRIVEVSKFLKCGRAILNVTVPRGLRYHCQKQQEISFIFMEYTILLYTM